MHNAARVIEHGLDPARAWRGVAYTLIPMATDRPDASEVGFDERLARLEAIVQELEGGGLSLERSIERYQEGIALLRTCQSTLQGFQRQVEELTREAQGALTPYAGDPDAAPGASAR
jgi:exodeoxyribonuclease VII small subunit